VLERVGSGVWDVILEAFAGSGVSDAALQMIDAIILRICLRANFSRHFGRSPDPDPLLNVPRQRFHSPHHRRNLAPRRNRFGRVAPVLERVSVTLRRAGGHSAVHPAATVLDNRPSLRVAIRFPRE
jgi:hypothetical protein